MSPEQNKALVRRYIEAVDANRAADWDVLDDYLAADFVSHNPPLPGIAEDRAGVKAASEIFRTATPGTHEITLQIAEGDLVVSHMRARGTHVAEFMGIPATNKDVETEGIAIHRVRDGQIVEHWAVTDVAQILQQLGVLPGPPG